MKQHTTPDWRIIFKKAGIIFLSIILFALCCILIYMTKTTGSIHQPESPGKPAASVHASKPGAGQEAQGKKDGYWTIAVFGVDSRNGDIGKDNNGDVQLLCSISRATGDIRLVSVYRDSYMMNNTGTGDYGKLDQAYFEQGPQGNAAVLSTNLDLDVDDYITFNWKGAADAINLLGGVDIDLSKAEFYYMNAFITETVNSTGVPSLPLEGPGLQHLDGVQAVAYMRLRKMDTDFARTERQRKVIAQIFEKARSADASVLIQLFDAVVPQIGTSIDEKGFLDILYHVKDYRISATSAFPAAYTVADMGKSGSCVIPNTLETNVEELHRFLYGDEDYRCTEQVKDISREIIKRAVRN